MVYLNETQIQGILWLGFAIGTIFVSYFAIMYFYITKRYERMERLLNERYPNSGNYYRELRKL